MRYSHAIKANDIRANQRRIGVSTDEYTEAMPHCFIPDIEPKNTDTG